MHQYSLGKEQIKNKTNHNNSSSKTVIYLLLVLHSVSLEPDRTVDFDTELKSEQRQLSAPDLILERRFLLHVSESLSLRV